MVEALFIYCEVLAVKWKPIIPKVDKIVDGG